MTVRPFLYGLLMLCAGPVQALGLLDAYDLAVRNDPTFQAAIIRALNTVAPTAPTIRLNRLAA